jgi:hypothetical protein
LGERNGARFARRVPLRTDCACVSALLHRPVHPRNEGSTELEVGGKMAAAVEQRRVVTLLVAASIVGGTSVGCAANSASSGVSSPPPQWLVDKAQQMAVENGDPSPAMAEFVLTNGAEAAPVVGTAGGDVNSQEYLVLLGGQFVDKYAHLPPGAEPPKGSFLVFTLDPSTHLVNDSGLVQSSPDLSGLGPMESFTLDQTSSPSV